MNPMLQQARQTLGGGRMPEIQQAPAQQVSPFSDMMRRGLQQGAFGQMGNEQFQQRYDPRDVQQPGPSPLAMMMQQSPMMQMGNQAFQGRFDQQPMGQPTPQPMMQPTPQPMAPQGMAPKPMPMGAPRRVMNPRGMNRFQGTAF